MSQLDRKNSPGNSGTLGSLNMVASDVHGNSPQTPTKNLNTPSQVGILVEGKAVTNE